MTAAGAMVVCGEVTCCGELWCGEVLCCGEPQPLGADAGVAQPGERGGPAYAFCLAAARLFFCERAIVHVGSGLVKAKPQF